MPKEENSKIYVICQTFCTLGAWGAVAAIGIFNPTDVVWTLIAGVVATAIIWRGEKIFT